MISGIYWKRFKPQFTAKTLKNELNVKPASPKTAPKLKQGSMVLNWGMTSYPFWGDDFVFVNHPDAVAQAVNKIVTLTILRDHNIPTLIFSAKKKDVVSWLHKGKLAVARTLTRASKGRGIKLIENDSDIINAPLYTRYYGKTTEFRIHCFGNKVIDRIQKKRKTGKEADNKIRTFANGWIFAHENVPVFNSIDEACCEAISILNLQFGAVDVLANLTSDGHLKNFVICEVNTAPGLTSPTTLGKYINAIGNYS